jgi:hypothetical protein
MRLRLVPSLFLIRRLVAELRGIREQLTAQTAMLTRLADHLAPQPLAVDRTTIAEETGLDYVDPVDQALAQQYVARTVSDTGHTPTDDEILSYLADEKTVDLHARLVARDQELDRIARERR